LLEIQQYCVKLACDVQALSQGLHSSTLEYLGIVAGLESLCRDFAAHHDVSVCFYPENIPLAVNKDLELGLYRIAQEALQNAGKHSGSGDFSVTLRSSGDELLLEVRDWGVGFSPKDAAREGGLGLISMKERVLLMSGSFSIESKANWGTRVTARVPLHGGLRDCGGGLTRKHGFNASSDFARAV
jgi:signal transduction histidine kinase